MTGPRCLWAGLACTVIAGVLIGLFSDQIFAAQNVSAQNQVISIQVLEPGLELEVTP